MDNEPRELIFTVSAYTQTVKLRMFPGSTLEKLYNNFRSSNSDEDWDDLVDWAVDDIASGMDIEVEEVM